ncbi:TIGR02301 family protein [uncultured Caulobacter sp.]|uniref:TIGR02301 family protein n=1 Tax=uncultured Caulobacter sp. TaxID=158749 RepID=UPI00260C32C4|nr:TIGR02301 family protein [uncultured Caulobacter sp.]
MAITNGMFRQLFSGLLVAALAGAAVAQDRPADQRQRLLELAYALGESHALRQACEGEGDQFWRARMMRLVQVERPGPTLETQLRERFNAGFVARRGQYPACDEASHKAEAQAARRGQALALKLSQSTIQVRRDPPAPDSVADGEAAR